MGGMGGGPPGIKRRVWATWAVWGAGAPKVRWGVWGGSPQRGLSTNIKNSHQSAAADSGGPSTVALQKAVQTGPGVFLFVCLFAFLFVGGCAATWWPQGGPAMPTDVVAIKAGSHKAGGTRDGHRLGSWTVMPRTGPCIARGPGTRPRRAGPGTGTKVFRAPLGGCRPPGAADPLRKSIWPRASYPMLRNCASRAEIGLLGQIWAGF